ncbi:hypothetical protein [Nostoc sp.]|uniref:hypothetical protein n=1 Tax=Nostoc sp. TaxID=1180 RepID=UPI002FF7EDDE
MAKLSHTSQTTIAITFFENYTFFTKGDRFCHGFAHDRQSTWKNFDRQKITAKLRESRKVWEQSKQLLEIAKTGVERAIKTDEATSNGLEQSAT